MSKQARRLAVGDVSDFPQDKVVAYMTKHAEEIFEPKRITSDSDWLKSYREPDQRYCYYKEGRGNIKWLSPTKNKIYLFIADPESFTDAQIAQYKSYVEAFFTGVAEVGVIKGGADIPGKPGMKLPTNFLDTVEKRDQFWSD